MFVTVALIGPNACSWPVSHLWSVLSAPRAPVTGSRLMASVENRGSDDCSGQIHVGTSKIWLCDPSVQMWMLKFIISKFHFTGLCPQWPKIEYCNEASLTVFSCLNQIDLSNNWKMTERCPIVCVKTLFLSHWSGKGLFTLKDVYINNILHLLLNFRWNLISLLLLFYICKLETLPHFNLQY